MILVDTSIWIEFDHRRVSLPEQQVAVCPPIVQEVLQGVSELRYPLMRNALYEATMLDAPLPLQRFEYAVALYRRCRESGITPRSAIDCLIAAIAIAHDVPLLHDDRDFENIKRVAPLKTLTL